MAQPIEHPEWNVEYRAGEGDEDRVGTIRCFAKRVPGTNMVASVTSAWKLTPGEIEEINRTGIVMMNSLYGLAPHFIGSESVMKEFLL
jgi:hypothetical protein